MLWHAYPVIGIDDRNQFDYYRDVPGIRELVAELQARGLRVFVNYNPWDVGTRREPVADDLAIAELVRELGVDGVFLDTMKEAQPGLRAALDGVKAGDRARGRVDAAARAHVSTTTSPGRSGSRTATCRECSARAGSSSGTCSITPAAGTATTPRSCTAPG